jgi:hypothetical protein
MSGMVSAINFCVSGCFSEAAWSSALPDLGDPDAVRV